MTPSNTGGIVKVSFVKPEFKLKNINLRIEPSLIAQIHKCAKKKNTSVSDYIRTVLRAYTEHETHAIGR